MPEHSPPPLRLPDPVREDLEAHESGLAQEMERRLLACARPCVAVTAERVSENPLRRNLFGRGLGMEVAEPILGVTASKFGGLPYCEPDEDWSGQRFLGQIDLAAATSVLPDADSRLRGLLRISLGPGASPNDFARACWFETLDPSHTTTISPPSVGKWETCLRFELAWTLPEGDELEAIWPLTRSKWFEYDRFYPDGYNEDGFDGFHRLLGHRSSGLDEHYASTPPPGLDDDINEYESLLRLTFDNAADFGWGTNWLYILVPRDDLRAGDLSRIVVTGANS